MFSRFVNKEKASSENSVQVRNLTWRAGFLRKIGLLWCIKPSSSQLISLVEEGNIWKLQTCIQNGANLNIKNGNGDTLVTMAVKQKNHHVLKQLLENGAHINIPNNDWSLPVHHVAKLNSLDIINTFFQLSSESSRQQPVNLDIDRKAANADGKNFIEIAVEHHNEWLLTTLMKSGLDFEESEIQVLKKNPKLFKDSLNNAIMENNLEFTNKLLDLGTLCDTNHLELAISKNNHEIVTSLHQHGVDFSKNNIVNCLYQAIKKNQNNMVHALLDAGVNINKSFTIDQDHNLRDDIPLTCLQRVISLKDSEMLKKLKVYGADFNYKVHPSSMYLNSDSTQGYTIAHFVISCSMFENWTKDEQFKWLVMLKEYGTNFSEESINGITPAFYVLDNHEYSDKKASVIQHFLDLEIGLDIYTLKRLMSDSSKYSKLYPDWYFEEEPSSPMDNYCNELLELNDLIKHNQYHQHCLTLIKQLKVFFSNEHSNSRLCLHKFTPIKNNLQIMVDNCKFVIYNLQKNLYFPHGDDVMYVEYENKIMHLGKGTDVTSEYDAKILKKCVDFCNFKNKLTMVNNLMVRLEGLSKQKANLVEKSQDFTKLDKEINATLTEINGFSIELDTMIVNDIELVQKNLEKQISRRETTILRKARVKKERLGTSLHKFCSPISKKFEQLMGVTLPGIDDGDIGTVACYGNQEFIELKEELDEPNRGVEEFKEEKESEKKIIPKLILTSIDKGDAGLDSENWSSWIKNMHITYFDGANVTPLESIRIFVVQPNGVAVEEFIEDNMHDDFGKLPPMLQFAILQERELDTSKSLNKDQLNFMFKEVLGTLFQQLDTLKDNVNYSEYRKLLKKMESIMKSVVRQSVTGVVQVDAHSVRISNNAKDDSKVKDNINKLCNKLVENSDMSEILERHLMGKDKDYIVNLGFICGQFAKAGVLGYHHDFNYEDQNESNNLLYQLAKECFVTLQKEPYSIKNAALDKLVGELQTGECIESSTGKFWTSNRDEGDFNLTGFIPISDLIF